MPFASTITRPSFVVATNRSVAAVVGLDAAALGAAALDAGSLEGGATDPPQAGTPAGALAAVALTTGAATAGELAAAALVGVAVELLEHPLTTSPPTVMRAAPIPRNLLLFNGFSPVHRHKCLFSHGHDRGRQRVQNRWTIRLSREPDRVAPNAARPPRWPRAVLRAPRDSPAPGWPRWSCRPGR